MEPEESAKLLPADPIAWTNNIANRYLNGHMWQVTSSARTKVAGEYCSSGNKTVTLPAGEYRLDTTTDITRNAYGTYSPKGTLNG
jgi:hypothetical protein